MRLGRDERKVDCFYVGDMFKYVVPTDDGEEDYIYKVVQSAGYACIAACIEGDSDDEYVMFTLADGIIFLQRSTKPFDEIFFKGDKTIYYDDYSNRTEITRHPDDEDNPSDAVLLAVAKAKGVTSRDLFRFFEPELYRETIRQEKQERKDSEQLAKFVEKNELYPTLTLKKPEIITFTHVHNRQDAREVYKRFKENGISCRYMDETTGQYKPINSSNCYLYKKRTVYTSDGLVFEDKNMEM